MLNAPIATFTTVSLEKLIQSSIASSPIAQALMGLGDVDEVPAEVNVADAINDLTFRARDVAFVGAVPQPIPEEVTRMFNEANVDLTTAFLIGFNPQTTGMTNGVLIVGANKADFLIWWNEFGG